ncbi:helix-turn-helix domain-containing protein [Nocardia cyriacigeorgica]|uniref:helix-turn-helix domain-containing protein n=1 Tax=Nocardia cyriacigeorgica TaxID=135487 RepID=UPI0024586566|nr:helix-turn-helix transcriptional regulator [Nocardia cyriacigeorgica]
MNGAVTMSESRASVAARVAEARKLAGLTQQQLADKSNVSVGLLRSVEQKRVSATPGFLGAVSKALNVSVTELTGQPYPPAPGPDTQVHTAIPILRAELAAYDMDNTRVTETRPMQEMAASVVKVRRSRRAASFHRLGESLPPLLGELRAAGLTAGGDWAAALAYLERCRARIEPRLGIGRRDDLIAWGGLHLQSGLAASRSGKRDLADAHLAEARATALRLGDDRDPILSFGPTNVGIWSVALAVEAMDGTEALNRARSLVIPADAPKERAGHHYIDLSRAHLLHGDRRRSFAALQMAKDIAPSQTRYNPMVHETVRALARAEARTVDTVHGFAVWCGIAERL